MPRPNNNCWRQIPASRSIRNFQKTRGLPGGCWCLYLIDMWMQWGQASELFVNICLAKIYGAGIKQNKGSYHLPKNCGNFGWNVNGKNNFVSLNGTFLGKTGFLERKVDQNSQTKFLNGKCTFHLLVFTSSRPFGLDCPWSCLMEKSRGNGMSASRENFHLGFDAFHLV